MNGFLCPLIVFLLKVKYINEILKDVIKLNKNVWLVMENLKK